MEQAVLKTLIYGDLFDYPLKAWEIHKWLIGKKCDLIEVERALLRLMKKGKVKQQGDYYYLSLRKGLVKKRLQRADHSSNLLTEAERVSWILRHIPGVLLIGVSGALAMQNADTDDDIDLFIITKPQRLWLVRAGILGILGMMGKKRSPQSSRQQAAGTFCVNTILELEQLGQTRQDLYTAHEVLQMKVLWQKEHAYQIFLEENEWVFGYLPNWISGQMGKLKRPKMIHPEGIGSWINRWLEHVQLRYMQKPIGDEKISKEAVYFHPMDYRQQILEKYKSRMKS